MRLPTATTLTTDAPQLLEHVVAHRRHDLGTFEQARSLLGRRPVADVWVLEDLRERASAGVLAEHVADEELLLLRRAEQKADRVPALDAHVSPLDSAAAGARVRRCAPRPECGGGGHSPSPDHRV